LTNTIFTFAIPLCCAPFSSEEQRIQKETPNLSPARRLSIQPASIVKSSLKSDSRGMAMNEELEIRRER
jgi:hypothetical protein